MSWGRLGASLVTTLGLFSIFAPRTTDTALAQQAPPMAKPKQGKGQASDRAKALSLMAEHRDLEALPLLEAITKAGPTDRVARERLAEVLVTQSATVKPEEGAALRKRARAILLELKKTGNVSDLSELLAEGIPPDGGVQRFSTKADVDKAMKEGEAAFARRDFDAARTAYKRALRLDPRSYLAALFVRDTYFAEGKLREARTWFSRAIIADPDQEAAYRYLGDTHSKARRVASAHKSYLDAVIAQPYQRPPWAIWGNGQRPTR